MEKEKIEEMMEELEQSEHPGAKKLLKAIKNYQEGKTDKFPATEEDVHELMDFLNNRR